MDSEAELHVVDAISIVTGWPKKKAHTELSPSRIETCQ